MSYSPDHKEYSSHEIKELLRNDDIFTTLEDYCKYLASKYQETLEFKYYTKQADLYNCLSTPLNDVKLEELFNSFANSLDINPIIKIREDFILLRTI